jgi:antitoxin component YwqK of YwqJK toxin-antitoxin module
MQNGICKDGQLNGPYEPSYEKDQLEEKVNFKYGKRIH